MHDVGKSSVQTCTCKLQNGSQRVPTTTYRKGSMIENNFDVSTIMKDIEGVGRGSNKRTGNHGTSVNSSSHAKSS